MLVMSRTYKSFEDLANNPPIADIYITGSDQVWGPIENGSYDSSYCLSFTKKKKIAYGASFGHIKMTPNLKKYYKDMLSQYNHI